MQKILQDDLGLEYICQTGERYYAVSSVLSNMIIAQTDKTDVRLLKHIIRCYSRLIEHPNAREELRAKGGGGLATYLTDEKIRAFEEVLADDLATKSWLKQLLVSLNS